MAYTKVTRLFFGPAFLGQLEILINRNWHVILIWVYFPLFHARAEWFFAYGCRRNCWNLIKHTPMKNLSFTSYNVAASILITSLSIFYPPPPNSLFLVVTKLTTERKQVPVQLGRFCLLGWAIVAASSWAMCLHESTMHFVYDNSETLRTYRIKMDNNNVYRTSDTTYQVTTLSVSAMLSL